MYLQGRELKLKKQLLWSSSLCCSGSIKQELRLFGKDFVYLAKTLNSAGMLPLYVMVVDSSWLDEGRV